MGSLIQTPTHCGDDSKGSLWGLEGNLYLPMLFGTFVGLAICCSLLFVGRAGVVLSVGTALLAVSPVYGWVLLLKNRKPSGYDVDMLESLLGEGNVALNLQRFPQSLKAVPKRMNGAHKDEPEGFFTHDLMVYGNLDKGTTVSRGYELVFPDLQACSYEKLNSLHDTLSHLLLVFSERYQLQVHWYTTADYRQALLGYKEQTDQAQDAGTREYRNRIFCHLWEQMEKGLLRREHCVLLISKQLKENLPATAQTQPTYMEQLLEQLSAEWTAVGVELQGLLGNSVEVRPLDDMQHYLFTKRYVNPDLIGAQEEQLQAQFVPEGSIQHNCRSGDLQAMKEGCLYLDPLYLSAVTLKRWPERTFPGILTYLTLLPMRNYRIVVTVRALDKKKELQKEQRALDRIRGEYQAGGPHALTVAIHKKQTKIESLSSGASSPFEVDFVVYVWGGTVEELNTHKNLIRTAIANLQGAESAPVSLASSLRRVFALGWPGWTNSSYRHRCLYAENAYLADMLPFSSTFTGYLEGAEALYLGSKQNLVGVRTFLGGTPQHTVLLGMSGAGKSVHMDDLLRQTEALYGYTLIIEEGLSYKRFTEERGGRPILVHPDGELTLNYLDTQQLPLTPLQLTMAVSLLTKMVGEGNDRRENSLRQAQLAQYINRLYEDVYADWALQHSQRLPEIKRLACAAERWRVERLPLGTTFLEAWADLRERLSAQEDQAHDWVASFTEAQLTQFEQSPETERRVMAAAYAFFKKDDYPTHRMLVELMLSYQFPEHSKEEIHKTAVLLSAWTANAQYGKLFDGPSNVDLKGKIAHFELGYIPEEAVELKTAAGLLVTGFARQHILTLPRKVWKRILFEEVARFLDVPGGEKIVAEAYAQLRKFNCWTASIVQQYSKFKSTSIRPVIMGNSKQFFLMRQFDKNDIEDISKDIGVPETAQEQIMSYPLPEQLPEGGKFSSICYYAPGATRPFCGTVRNYQLPPVTTSHESAPTA